MMPYNPLSKANAAREMLTVSFEVPFILFFSEKFFMSLK